MKSSLVNLARKYHKWPALVISFFLVMFSLSGIIMNHRGISSRADVSRRLMPDSYSLRNWNLASVKSSLVLDDGSRIIYGNSGIWKCDSSYTVFTDLNSGLERGMDNRKVRSVIQLHDGSLLAGTFSGLYVMNRGEGEWQKINAGTGNARIQDLIYHDSVIIAVTRSELVRFDAHPERSNGEVIVLKTAEGEKNTISLFRLFWIMHSGEIIGVVGRLVLDAMALIILLLVVSGLLHFFIPRLSQKLKSSIRSLPVLRKNNLLLHNKAGAWFFVLLLFVPFTGMFLRPPFLISIASGRVSVPSLLEGSNPWEDRLRAIVWAPELNGYLLSTSEGFYYCDADLREAPVAFAVQPPVSVMGINVFMPAGQGSYYAGSFDGLFLWNPLSGSIYDMLPVSGNDRRASQNLISGMIKENNRHILFDFDRGELSGGVLFPQMPGSIIESSPMPLWNVAQEIHTGRIYQPLLGPFYILVVPLIAITSLLVFVTGYYRWRKLYRKR